MKAQAPNAVCVTRADQRRDQPDHQSRDAAVRQSPISAARWRCRSTARPSSTSCSRARPTSAAPCCRRPAGVWGMPPEMLETMPGYGPDVKKNRDEARKLMEKAGYGPDKRLKMKVSTRNIAVYRDPGGDPDRPAQGHLYRRRARRGRDRASGSPKVARKDYTVGLNLTGSAASTIRTRPSTRTTAAARSATTRTTATRSCEKLFDAAVAARPTSRSARSWCGRSTRSCRRTWRGRSSIHARPGPAGQPYVKDVTIMVEQHLQRLALRGRRGWTSSVRRQSTPTIR